VITFRMRSLFPDRILRFLLKVSGPGRDRLTRVAGVRRARSEGIQQKNLLSGIAPPLQGWESDNESAAPRASALIT